MDAVKHSNLHPDVVAKLESNASLYWDSFYHSHADGFFKDRHWFAAEFPHLLTCQRVLEVGCGTGATVYPLLELNPSAHVYACDFAPTAVELVLNHPAYSADHVTAFVADITSDALTNMVPEGTIEACTMIFVLSAIVPGAKMAAAVAHIAQTLIPCTGRVLFRDYAIGDQAENKRRVDGKQQKIRDGFYARGDGTLAYYFTEEVARKLFENAGFRCERLETLCRVKTNNKTGISMGRKFIQGIFILEDAAKAEVAAAKAAEEEQQQQERRKGASNGCTVPDMFGNGGAGCGSFVENKEDILEANLSFGLLDLHLTIPVGLNMGELEESSPSLTLAHVIQACPRSFRKTVAEVGCGSVALPSLAALQWCSRALATDPRPECIAALRRNSMRNGHRFVYERLRIALMGVEEPDRELERSADIVLAAIYRSNSDKKVKRDEFDRYRHILGTAARLASDGAGVLVAVAAEDALLVEEAGKECGLQVVSPPEEIGRALRGIDVHKNVVLWMEKLEGF